MKKTKSLLLILIIATIISGCGNSNNKTNYQEAISTNSTKQQEIEAENEKLKTETEILKKELAEKEAAEKKENEALEAKKVDAEQSKKTKAADMMNTLVPYIVDDDDGFVDEKTYNYIVEHYELFPALNAESKKAAKVEVDTSITTRHLNKNINPYLDKMIEVSGYVVQIEENEIDSATVAEVHILDDNGNSIIGIYLNSTGDILDDDFVTMRGVPTARYSFDNIGGGTTNAILLTVSTIQKSK